MALNLDAIGEKIGPLEREYSWKDVVLYALGVGAGFDELHFVYEDRLKVIPSFSIASIFDFLAETAVKANVDLSGILHGEQDIIFHNPIPTEGRLITEGRLTHMYDKGREKGALVMSEAVTRHSGGQKLYTNYFTLFCRKDGGFGGEPGPSESVAIPDREPDFVHEDLPDPQQPLTYRLSGDIFALHVDPEYAKRSGFEKPIMHGLCTHGFACRAVIAHLMPGQPERMTRFRVRFSQTLYPGVPIKTLIWQVGEGKAYFRTINAESGDVVLDHGIVEWLSEADLERRRGLGAINFQGQVAIVTGAGAGLGRAYALELAKRGAKVVVNDLGGAADGTGGSASPADQVVAEITGAGGEAIANYDSVATPEGGEAIVRAALDAWGRVDVLINNAGILRDKSLLKMEPENWNAVIEVHLNGAYYVTRPAFQAMKKAGYGRILFTTSAAGLYGNFGQTNYSAAKLGLVGLLNTVKLEGERFGIKANAISPVAGTRLTDGILPPDIFEKLKPEFVAPMALYLVSEQCPVTGGIYNAGMGFFNRAAMVTGKGAVVGGHGEPPSAEAVAAAMSAIKNLEGAGEFPDTNAALAPMVDALDPASHGAAPAEPASGAGVAAVFDQMPQAFLPDAAAGVEVVFGFEISGPDGGQWHATVGDQKCRVAEGAHDAPTTTIKMSDEDFLAMIRGQLNPMSAYTSGKLKIGGDLMKSQLIQKLFRF